MKRYTEEQALWIRENAEAREWANAHSFAEAFNAQFDDPKSVDSILSYMQKRGIKFRSRNRMPKNQAEWIRDNCQVIVWRNTKHFTDTFNAIFGTNKSHQTMNSYLNKNGLQIKSGMTVGYSKEMDQWLIENYEKYECDFVKMAKDFNRKFGTNHSNCRIAKHCERGLKIHKPAPKNRMVNKGQVKKGEPTGRGLPIGTIRYNSDGRPFIKVKENDGSNTKDSQGGHNYKEPWWKPLQKKIWEDNYGEVPKGYEVCSLNGDQNDTNIEDIGIIDRRGKAVMAKKGWWTDNEVITGDGMMWCNLYYTAKDNGIDV